MSLERQRSFRDRYLLTIAVPGLDRRLAIAMGVALDALQQR
jgi:ribosome maturation factor RimP